MNVRIVCTACGQEAQPLDWRCTACEGALDLQDLPNFDANKIDEGDFTLWRYSAFLPVEKRISLGEGMTPLAPVENEYGRIWLKQEYLNPTGSYKDRGTVTMMNHLASHDVRDVVEDSSGNAGASVAAYSSALDIASRIYVPASGSPSKKALIEAFGGTLMEIEGAQYAKTQACEEAAKTTPYASHAWSPYFVLGQMTAAFEVWEQLGRRAPKAIATPLGHGGLFLGFAQGFAMLHEAGLIDTMPRLYAIQASLSDPIVQGWEQGADVPPRVDTAPTVADGIIVDVPVRGREVLQAIRESQGAALRVEEDAILGARDALALRGFIVEPTSAVTWAALPQIKAHLGDDDIVLALTGNGLKYVGR
jgi:threonine synthase